MLSVRDAMTRDVLTVAPTTPLKQVARVLLGAGISGLPVVDDDGVVVGVVSETDFLVKGQGQQAIRHRFLSRFVGDTPETRQQLAKIGARTAGEAMSSPAVTIAPGRPIQEAAAAMTGGRVNRLPVIDNGRLVGIVTRADLVRAYVRSDEELAASIREDVLLRGLWLDPAGFQVTVLEGEATIRGHVDRRSTAEALEEDVASMPGIVAVATEIRWAVDDRDIKPAIGDPLFPHGIN